MAEETTPPPEADEPKPEAAAEEATAPEGADASTPEDALEAATATDDETLGEAPEPAADAERSSPAPAAAVPADAANEEAEEEELEPAYPAWAFRLGLVVTIAAVAAISVKYAKKFTPLLHEVAAFRELVDRAESGNATAQLQLATNYFDSYQQSETEGLPDQQMLVQAYAWVSLAARVHVQSEDETHAKDGKADAGAGKENAKEPKKEETPEVWMSRGVQFALKANEGTRKEKHQNLELAYKWLTLAQEGGQSDQNATTAYNSVRQELTTLGDDYIMRADSVVAAHHKMLEWRDLLDPDELENAQKRASVHAIKAATGHGHGAGHRVHWTYTGITGPEHWGELSPDFWTASRGTRQSPINIVRAEARTAKFLKAVEFHYNPRSTFEVRNNGHTLHVNVTSPPGEPENLITIGGDHYRLLRFHFHAQSEHTLDGRHSPMEMHLVHERIETHEDEVQNGGPEAGHTNDTDHGSHDKGGEKQLAVIGVMIEELPEESVAGPRSDFIRKVWATLPALEKQTPKSTKGVLINDMHPVELLPREGRRSYFQYRGSLTTPPCTENVLWTVLEEPVYYTKEQIERFMEMPFFKKIGGKNNRPVMPQQGRFVIRYQDYPRWSYEGKTGPEYWSKLNPAWSVAGKGKRQSPIDIVTTRAVDGMRLEQPLQRPVQVFYNPTSTVKVVNNGRTIQANLESDDNNTIMLGGERYNLLQFHFHHRSEHRIDGKDFPMEVHLVHAQEANPAKLAVIGVMIDEGPENAALKEIWENLPKPARHDGGHQIVPSYTLDPTSLIPREGDYFQYRGSLTTPPCTENVFWTVMEKPIEMSAAQVEVFRKLLPHNSRNVQEAFDRLLMRYNVPGN
ncbi:MAG: hypothetical protein CL444_04915 [Acidimicrobiaceae bacterium]|nr:hypothetical protein [Acidimicrobiaceae bacterium]